MSISEFALSEKEKEAFRRDGVIGPFKLYEPDEAAALYKRIRPQLFNRELAVYDLPMTSPIANYDRHLDIDELSEHVTRPEIVGRVRSVLGPDILCWRSEMFPKYPGDEGTDWHQADNYAHASGKPQVIWPGDQKFGGAITVWTAFTEADQGNGCMKFIPGTHEEMFYDEMKRMKYNPDNINSVERGGEKRGFFGYDYRSLQKDPDWIPDESLARPMIMKPGEFIIFWSTLMHASYPNTSKNRTRMAFASRYVPTAVQIYPDTDVVEEYGSRISLENFGTVVVSGRNDYTHNRVVTVNRRGMPFRTWN